MDQPIFFIDNIDEHIDKHNHTVSPGQLLAMASFFMPSYFSSMLYVESIEAYDLWAYQPRQWNDSFD